MQQIDMLSQPSNYNASYKFRTIKQLLDYHPFNINKIDQIDQICYSERGLLIQYMQDKTSGRNTKCAIHNNN